MKVFSVIGMTKSGKTTTIEEIIKELKRRQFSVGSIKEIHYEKFAIDREGSNTYRHRASGSELVTARSHHETDIMHPAMLPIEDILQSYVQDYVVMEGVSESNVPLILCAHDRKDIEKHRQKDYYNRIFAISGVFSNEGDDFFEKIPVYNAKENIAGLIECIMEKVFKMLPDFLPACCSGCGFGCRVLCARILKGQSKRSDCVLSDSKIALSIEGKNIPMVPFVQQLLTDTIKALISNLDGYKKGKKVEIVLKD